MQRKVKCINNSVVYMSVSEAGRALNIDKGAISRVCNGAQKQAKGYIFEFVNDRENVKNNNNNNVVQQLENIQSKVNIIYSLLTKDKDNNINNNVDITPDHQEQFKNVLTQPTLDLLALTNMELVEALAGDILAYRDRVKAELRKLAGHNTNPVIEPQQEQQDETGWDDIEIEAKENNPVMVSKEPPQPQEQREPQPTKQEAKNPAIIEAKQEEADEQESKKLYKTIDPATLSEEEKECRKRAGVPLDIDLGDVDDGWDDFDIDDSLVIMR